MTLLWLSLGVVLGVALTLAVVRYTPGLSVRPKGRRDRDRLTGLRSPERFEEELLGLLTTLQQRKGEGCLIYLGLDGFRLVNDEHGKSAGDQVLVRTTERLRHIAGKRALLGRMTGDEFVVWCAGTEEVADVLVKQLLEALAEPVLVNDAPVKVTLSVGVALAPQHGHSVRLIKRAQTAMRSVKRLGGNAHAIFDARQEEEMREELMLAKELRHAVDKFELELVYQPKMDARTLQVTAVEALLRWRHPTMGMVSPARFIPIAERYGLIHAIGDWVTDTALAQAASWRTMGLHMRVAINVSGFQMRQDDFASRLEKGLKRHNLRPERFTCEITESVAMENTAVTERAFQRLAKLGVHVSIDDFGTGYSGLASLRNVPAQELKIDRAFVADVATSSEAQAIVKAVVDMARALQLKVVAEGVETTAQRDLLVTMGCDELQGYLFAKPMSARAIEVLASDVPEGRAEEFRPSIFRESLSMPLAARR